MTWVVNIEYFLGTKNWSFYGNQSVPEYFIDKKCSSIIEF